MQQFWQWMSLIVFVVLIGVVLKDAQGASTIMTGFANSYSTLLGTLEKAG
jgi:hypothetical protein